MTCIRCKHNTAYKFGTYGKRKFQRYRCQSCKITFADAPTKTLGKHYTDIERVSKVLGLMLEGMSIRAISRLTDLDKNTIISLMVDAGEHCRRVFDRTMQGVRPWHVQADEIWSFVGCHPGPNSPVHKTPASSSRGMLDLPFHSFAEFLRLFNTDTCFAANPLAEVFRPPFACNFAPRRTMESGRKKGRLKRGWREYEKRHQHRDRASAPLFSAIQRRLFFIQKARRNSAAVSRSNRINSLASVAPQFLTQKLCRSTQNLRGFTQKLSPVLPNQTETPAIAAK